MMLSPIEQSFIDDIIAARYPDVTPEPQAAPVQLAARLCRTWLPH
jgi:hypothetical protein